MNKSANYTIYIFARRYTAMNKSTKLEISLFKTALAYVGVDVDDEEVECMLANMIYRVRIVFFFGIRQTFIYFRRQYSPGFGILGLDLSSL